MNTEAKRAHMSGCNARIKYRAKQEARRQLIYFVWHRRPLGRNGVQWQLWSAYNARMLGQCFYMPGSKRYRCAASAPTKDGVVLTEYWAGTAAAARSALERDWHKRSIGLFGVDDIEFRRAS